ncbi:hypothetical protein [Thalassorhabdomicrobium marinisediminis]|uniref:Uncharacterized protein n=1 Tax=Thalassorhabdomicrobium marinisediminis TaxID=2170577 RepID=A0A2T7G0R8_9RHOB|nr:hypothetical protein [Thalassorhabdomicrobium marinisediminis]PVA08007.1 hypothetical protein DC363_00460 [Thalassorhabdomicrobium marinisediminis]
MSATRYPETPDGRYFVAKGRLWRKSDPALDEGARQAAVNDLMAARRAVRDARTEAETRAARARVDAAKVALGERGPVWWIDGTPDEGRNHPKNTRYADWWAALPAAERQRGLN